MEPHQLTYPPMLLARRQNYPGHPPLFAAPASDGFAVFHRLGCRAPNNEGSNISNFDAVL